MALPKKISAKWLLQHRYFSVNNLRFDDFKEKKEIRLERTGGAGEINRMAAQNVGPNVPGCVVHLEYVSRRCSGCLKPTLDIMTCSQMSFKC